MSKLQIVVLLSILHFITSASAQIILEPAQCIGTVSINNCRYTSGAFYNDYHVNQSELSAHRGFKYTGACHWTITFGCGIIEFNIDHTTNGGDFPTSGMTQSNWTAKLNGLHVIGAYEQGQSIDAGIYNLHDSEENGQITQGDWNSGAELIQSLFVTVPEVGVIVNEIDITDALRHDLFDPGQVAITGFSIEPSSEGWGWPRTRISFDPSLLAITVNVMHTPTPVFTPTPTMTPFEEPLGVDLIISENMFYPQSEFWLKARLRNPGYPRVNVPLFVILDLGGRLFFLPDWTEYPSVDYLVATVDLGATEIEVIEPFLWPDNVGSASGIYFHAAMVDQSLTHILGEPDSVKFGWMDS